MGHGERGAGMEVLGSEGTQGRGRPGGGGVRG